MNSLKVPKGGNQNPLIEEETDNTMAKRKRTDNTMAKRKRTNNDLQNIHIKLMME